MNQKQRDLLCKMLNNKASDIKRQLNKDAGPTVAYRVRSNLEEGGESFGRLSKARQKTFMGLTKRQDKHDAEEKSLRKDWNGFCGTVIEDNEGREKESRKAIAKLEVALEHATIEVQFAADAGQAKAIVSGLPTAEELMN